MYWGDDKGIEVYDLVTVGMGICKFVIWEDGQAGEDPRLLA